MLDSHLRARLHGNAGAISSLPLVLAGAPRDTGPPAPPQLLSVASHFTLDLLHQGAGLDIAAVADTRALQAPWWPLTEAWLAEAAVAIAGRQQRGLPARSGKRDPNQRDQPG